VITDREGLGDLRRYLLHTNTCIAAIRQNASVLSRLLKRSRRTTPLLVFASVGSTEESPPRPLVYYIVDI